ncbi:MAG: hypothetical protein ABI178_14385 [Rhodanobacter sp.]
MGCESRDQSAPGRLAREGIAEHEAAACLVQPRAREYRPQDRVPAGFLDEELWMSMASGSASWLSAAYASRDSPPDALAACLVDDPEIAVMQLGKIVALADP